MDINDSKRGKPIPSLLFLVYGALKASAARPVFAAKPLNPTQLQSDQRPFNSLKKPLKSTTRLFLMHQLQGTSPCQPSKILHLNRYLFMRIVSPQHLEPRVRPNQTSLHFYLQYLLRNSEFHKASISKRVWVIELCVQDLVSGDELYDT
ncbi:MAG: hypothetical protein J3R72DRAFT_496339 [Linnemannia gamsii]|nr:MAG: hypothetical protein J3R72DRAFT_496339 [Linnemannia gamsii]